MKEKPPRPRKLTVFRVQSSSSPAFGPRQSAATSYVSAKSPHAAILQLFPTATQPGWQWCTNGPATIVERFYTNTNNTLFHHIIEAIEWKDKPR